MYHNVQWTTGYTVLLEAAQVVYSVDNNSSKRCSYWKEHYSEHIILLNVLKWGKTRRKHFSYEK